MKISNYVNAVLAAMLLCACSSGEGNEFTDGPDTPSVKKLPILISTVWSGIEDTRATDYSFESGDEAGLYVVNHNSDGTASDLKNTGNHVDNMKFTYNGTWTPESQIYWLDDKTHAFDAIVEIVVDVHLHPARLRIIDLGRQRMRGDQREVFVVDGNLHALRAGVKTHVELAHFVRYLFVL